MKSKSKNNSLEELISIVKRLRSSDGCEWDKQQTHESLIPYFLEESYEVIEAIENNDFEEGTIVAEIAKGYIIRNKVLKYSKVCVSKKKNN